MSIKMPKKTYFQMDTLYKKLVSSNYRLLKQIDK